MTPRERAGSHRFSLLLGAIFLQLLLCPLLLATFAGVLAERAIGALVLVAALHAVGTRRRTLPLFGTAVVALVLAGVSSDPRIEVAAVVLRLGCLALVQVSLISHVLRQREVTFDTIAAAACAYVVFGAIWGDVYFLLALGVPDSFAIPATLLSGAGALRVALAYFSFETLTTIAYGDIHPTTAGAGGLAISEAIVGQLYLAIMITRLVALQLAGRSDPRPAPEE